MTTLHWLRACCIAAGPACVAGVTAAFPPPPETPRAESGERRHGRDVKNPYAWLEKTGEERTRAWVRAQDRRTLAILDPERRARRGLMARLSDYARQPKINTPVRRGGRFFFMIDSRRHRSPAIYASDGENDDLLASADDFASIGMPGAQFSDFRVSPDGSLIAIVAREPATGRRTLRILDVAKKAYLPGVAEGAWLGDEPWRRDGKAIYYATRPGEEPAALWRWRLTGPTEKILQAAAGNVRLAVDVIGEGNGLLAVERSRDNAYRASVLSSDGVVRNELHRPAAVRLRYIGYAAGAAYFHETSASNGTDRIMRWPLGGTTSRAEIVCDLAKLNVTMAYLYGERIVLQTTEHGAPQIRIHELDGDHLKTLTPPFGLLWTNFPVERPAILGDPASRYAYAGSIALQAPGVYELDLTDLEFRPWRTYGGTANHVVVRRVAYASRDGTEIPMSLVHSKATRFGGGAPALVWVYGAHGFTATPYFNAFFKTFIDAGGVLAMPQVRGGGVHGAAWHAAGSRAKKKNTVADTLAALDWLIANNVTGPERLTLMGNSAGSVPAAAVALGRRDLVAALILEIPLSDLIRHPKWSGGWTQEFGDPDKADERAAILAFSPYEKALHGDAAPATLILAGENDTTAPPHHAYKLAAALQQFETADHPVLLRSIEGAGHQIGMNEAQRTQNQALELAFLSKFAGLRGLE